MHAVKELEEWLLNGLARCENDEWALANARDGIVTAISPWEAYDALAKALELTESQDSPFCFANGCFFVLALARKADTTHLSPEALSVIPALKAKAKLLHEQYELESVLAWFRV